MFAIERYKIIKNYLTKESKVEVATLSKVLGVSEVTIRRDLEKLENDGFLSRIHGGAILNQEANSIPILPAEDKNFKKYEEIANIAIHMIQDNDVIMLINGPINMQIAKKLSTKNNITVLTNDLLIALELSSYLSVKIVLLGGDVDYSSKAVFGKLTSLNIEKFFVNKVFLEVDGIDINTQITVSSIDKASLMQESIRKSREKIIVCLADAFNQTAFYSVDKITIADKIITNPSINNDYKRYLFNQDIPLFTSMGTFEGSV
ncbi:MAG TPA: DeoR/GlpR transcriptional regulator [Epulopiscium sp.]|nr:DeoR/GlpR transcriptional regulator [Candidatus Epulonipiscium sp.]